MGIILLMKVLIYFRILHVHRFVLDSLQFNSSALFKRSSPVREGKENSRETATTNIFKKSFIMKDADSFIRNIEEKFHKINSKTSK